MLKEVKFLFFLLSSICLFHSCTTAKKVKDGTQVVKANGHDVDVVEWTDVTNEKNPPIKDEQTPKKGEVTPSNNTKIGDKKSTYKIALVLPFSDVKFESKFLQYYGGAKVAAHALESEGISLEVNVYDSKDDAYQININENNTDLIFAPNDELQIKSLIEFGKLNRIPVVSPFFSLSSVENNPFYIQFKPSLKSHYATIVNHISKKFNANDVVLVLRDTKADKTWSKYFLSAVGSTFGSGSGNNFTELILIDDSFTSNKSVFKNLISIGKKVFIFPNYSYKDEKYLSEAVHKLKAEKGNQLVNVYGMLILKDSEEFAIDDFEKLNVKIPTSKFIDIENTEVKSFDAKFFDTTGALPDNDAYEGFDNLLFVGRCINKYGTNFQYNLKENESYYLQTAFNILPYKSEDSKYEFDYFENKHLDILEFNGLKFVISK